MATSQESGEQADPNRQRLPMIQSRELPGVHAPHGRPAASDERQEFDY
jgi:hypothetical protein